MNPKVPRRPGATAVSQATRAKRRKTRQCASQWDLCHQLPCPVCIRPRKLTPRIVLSVLVGITSGELFQGEPISVGHHCPTKGAGGVDKDCSPLCDRHHNEWHNIGEASFIEKYGVDCRANAVMIAEVRREHDERRQA